MEIKVIAGDITKTPAGAIILGLFEGVKRPAGELAVVDKALGGAVSQLISQGEIKGRLREVTIIHSLGKLPAARVAVAGLGKKEDLSPERVRLAVGEACRLLQQRGVGDAATVALGAGGIALDGAAQAVTEGALLGAYSFRRHMTKEAEHGELKRLTIVADKAKLPLVKKGSHKGGILAEATRLARDMVNEPANYMTPSGMAKVAADLAKTYGLELEVLERPEMRKLGMGALLGVTQGSRQPPKFIVLRYKGGTSSQLDLALVGKGVTFDSGGISLKSSEKMVEMKDDMAGGAAVMAALSAIAQLKLRLNVVALAPCTENLPSGEALKPGDVLTAMNGKTIEVISTDAEGRLVLADALSYAAKLGARRIVDVATLTGACHVALGDDCSGVLGNNQQLVDKLIAASAACGELMWQLPMYEQAKEQLKSEVADIKNVGGRWGGAITAAHFLTEFVGDIPWVHLDIAGTSLSEKERGYTVKGATGVAVRTLATFALSLVK
jgi:leucyl aminopeptidase